MGLRKAHFDDVSIQIGNKNETRVYTNSSFFDDCEFYQVDVTDKKVVIKKCCLDTPKNAKTIRRTKKGHIIFTLALADIPCGVYPFDKEETNDDELVFYYK
ncbi:MAG TPA: hypothetical protein PLN38_07485 [Chitinophagales bacterium]|nr:hypothetical protein [Chitinophagales bacterium]